MPIRVVVIDDDADYRSLFRFNLQLEHDITVIGEAAEGETGVALALQEQPDIVVMDLMMPRINGFEATKRLKRSQPAVKVLAVTSLSLDNEIRQKVNHSGADAILDKRDMATALVPMIRSLHKPSASPDSLLT
jgi:DNA-binding NarL/FixJ family response regulator